MIRTTICMAICLCFAFLAFSASAQPMRVEVSEPDSGRMLDAWLVLPDGDETVPAVVFLHGCSGLTFSGSPLATYNAWSAILKDAGYAVLMVDSAASRGFRGTCGPGSERATMYRERPRDAYAGLEYLQGLPRIAPDRVFLIGWSQGGGVALLTMNTESIGRPLPSPQHDFRGAVAFYPGKCSAEFLHAPYTSVEPGTWSTIAPMLILHGGRDNWTPAAPCQAFVDELQTRGELVEIIVYPDAVHSFDAPNLPLRPRQDVLTSRGEAPLVGTDPEARVAAKEAVLAFLADHS